MNSDDLGIFLRICEFGSISRCSIETGLSQAVLSRKISMLESELGTRLFHRSGRGLVATEHGLRLAEHTRLLQSDLARIEGDMRGLIGHGPKCVTIAAQPTVAKTAFAAIGKALLTRFPGIKIRFREGLGGHIREWLAGGDVDIALLYSSGQAVAESSDVLLREHLSFIVPGAFPEDFGQGFPSGSLCSYPLVLPSPPHGLRSLAQDVAAAAGHTLDIAMECDASVYITKQLVAEGCGCTILPMAAVLEEVSRGQLKAFRLIDPEVIREVLLICSQNRPPMARQWEVLQLIKLEIHRLVRDGAWPDAAVVEAPLSQG